MIFISVDLPAPFSPIRACTECERSLSETPSSATTPGNALRISRASSRYSAGASSATLLTGYSAPEIAGKVGGSYQLERHPHEARHALAPAELQRRIHGAAALCRCILEHGHLELSRLHRRESVGRG